MMMRSQFESMSVGTAHAALFTLHRSGRCDRRSTRGWAAPYTLVMTRPPPMASRWRRGWRMPGCLRRQRDPPVWCTPCLLTTRPP